MLKGKTILITGGGSGIGRALAVNLSKDNKVVICGRNPDKLKKAAALGHDIGYYETDLSIPSEIDRLFDRIAKDQLKLDVLFNNAGVSEIYEVEKSNFTTKEIFERLDINLSAPIALIQKFIRQVDENSPEQYIVNITSQIAIFPFPILGLYNPSKTGLSVYTRTLRQQLKGTKFKVVEVLPAQVATEMPTKLGNSQKGDNPDDFAIRLIAAINKGKLEYAPGSGLILLKLFDKFLPNIGLSITDKISRDIFKG